MDEKPSQGRLDGNGLGGLEPCKHVVGIGASAGGLEALERFFSALPEKTGASFVVVVHLSPDFKSLMPELLARHTKMPVQSARSDMVMGADHVYIIPPRKNITVEDGILRLRDQERHPGHAINLPVDEFLHSLATECGERAIAVILSGSGSDGSRGIRSVKEAGGLVFVQDPITAKFDGMPHSALNTGMADHTGSPDEIATRIASIVSRSTSRLGQASESALLAITPVVDRASGTDAVLSVLRDTPGGLDLSYYKRSMVMRRIQRRMTIHGIEEHGTYLQKLRDDQLERLALQREMLIGVTAFFRDTSPFERLVSTIIPELLQTGDGPLRVWVPACSTGEEAYSIAMLIEEAKEEVGSRRDYKVFATDIDDAALERAGRGTYAMSTIMDVSASRAVRFFEHHGGHYTVRPALREHMVFARHNLVRDAPFSKMDLVSCRNFLIYLEPPEHEQVLAALHFSLAVGGVLLLGSAESPAPFEDEFDTLAPMEKIFRKRRPVLLSAMRRRNSMADPISSVRRGPPDANDESFRRVLERVADLESKSYVILDSAGHVIDVVGDAAGVLQVPRGKPSTDIRRLVVNGLSIPLSSALQKIGEDQTIAYSVQLQGQKRLPGEAGNDAERDAEDGATYDAVYDAMYDDRTLVQLQLCDLPPSRSLGRRLLLVAERHRPPQDAENATLYAAPSTVELHTLEAQLRQTQEDLQATIAELQSTNEEQQATNEELVASNEELQSTNEELHSVNEELHTVNVEYQKKNHELMTLTADWNNLMQSIDVGTLYLDENLTIRRFSPAIASIVKLVDHDIGRPIQHFSHTLDEEFFDDISRVASGGPSVERQVRASDGTWLLMRVLPYKHGNTGETRGVIATFVDITGLRNSEESARLLSEQMHIANERLIRRGDELEEVFSIVSHDVKRPVGTIDGMLQLARQCLNESPAEAPENSAAALTYVESALAECKRMQRLLDDLQRISLIERSDMEVRNLDLQNWLDAFVAPFKEQCRERGVAFNCTCDNAQIRVAHMVLEQALTNLLENALNYGTSNPIPRIDVACSCRQDEVRISVTDNGKGIAPEHHERVFEIFRRLEQGTTTQGSGVGLVTVRRLVTKAGGDVHLESDLGKGAQFVVTMPCERLGVESKPFRTLLVEDDPLDAKLAQKALAQILDERRVRAETEWVETLADAARLLAQRSFDAVLLDLSLPDGHGLSLVPHINASHSDAIPLVILSGRGAGIQESAMGSSDMATFLPKTEFSTETLAAALDAARAQAKKQIQLNRPGFLPPSRRDD